MNEELRPRKELKVLRTDWGDKYGFINHDVGILSDTAVVYKLDLKRGIIKKFTPVQLICCVERHTSSRVIYSGYCSLKGKTLDGAPYTFYTLPDFPDWLNKNNELWFEEENDEEAIKIFNDLTDKMITKSLAKIAKAYTKISKCKEFKIKKEKIRENKQGG